MACLDAQGCTDHNLQADRLPTGADDPCNGSGLGFFCEGAFWRFVGDGTPCSERMFIRIGDTCGVNQWIELPSICNSFIEAEINTPQNVPGNTFTKMFFANEVEDILGDWDPVTSVFTAPRNGVYSVCNYVQFAFEDWIQEDSTMFSSIFVNGVFAHRLAVGTYYTPPDGTPHFRATGAGCKHVILNQGDTVELFVIHSDNINHQLLDVPGTNWLNIALVLNT